MKYRLKTIFLALLLILIGYFCINKQVLLEYWPVWTDEAVYADTLKTLTVSGNLGTQLWSYIPTFADKTLYYPPLYFFLMNVWTRLFSLDIETMRTLSLILITISAVILFYLMYKNKTKDRWSSLMILVVLITYLLDGEVLRAAHFSRPENLVLLCSLVVYVLMIMLPKARLVFDRRTLCMLVLIGIFSSAAFLSHYLGIYVLVSGVFALVVSAWSWKNKIKAVLVVIGVFLLPAGWWGLSIASQVNDLVFQIGVVNAKKILDMWRWDYILSSQSLLVVNICYGLVFLLSLLSWLKRMNGIKFVTIVFTFVSWVFAVFGKNLTYFVLPLPFLYLALYELVISHKKGKIKTVALWVTSVILILNAHNFVSYFFTLKSDAYSYSLFTKQILEHIPDKKTVFMSTIPDPYFAFLDENRNNRIYEYPIPRTELVAYQRVLDDSDYIVINSVYEPPFYGKLLPEYTKANSESIFAINAGHYTAYVIKLKPIEERSIKFSDK